MALSQDEITELRDTYNNLSAEELRGMRGDDDEQDALIDEILNKGKAVELEGGPLPTPEGDEPDADPDAEPDGDPDADPDADPAPDPAAVEVAPVAEAAAPVVAIPDVDLPPLDLSYLAEKFDTKLAALDTANAESLAKLMSGEIEAADYAKSQAQYLRDRDALKDQKQNEAEWGKTVHAFMGTTARESGVNYFVDDAKMESWDSWIKHLATKHPEKGDEWALREAHKKVLVEFNIAPAAAPAVQKAAETVADAKKVAQKTGRTPNLSNIPPTLSGLPAAAPAASGDGGEFEHLATLIGYKFEQAIARMTPDQRARYEAE